MNAETKKQDNTSAIKPIWSEAFLHIGECTGMIEMLNRQPDFAITAKVNGMEIGLCNNAKFIELLCAEIDEAQRCIDGKPNIFE